MVHVKRSHSNAVPGAELIKNTLSGLSCFILIEEEGIISVRLLTESPLITLLKLWLYRLHMISMNVPSIRPKGWEVAKGWKVRSVLGFWSGLWVLRDWIRPNNKRSAELFACNRFDWSPMNSCLVIRSSLQLSLRLGHLYDLISIDFNILSCNVEILLRLSLKLNCTIFYLCRIQKRKIFRQYSVAYNLAWSSVLKLSCLRLLHSKKLLIFFRLS